ncbi:hypothetical protein HPP92_021655 [Vanilla planifolia]|uniref:Uncharacterized protein n=1 Tax=Vanilla planifolia TaxID=51239 RepID=A0A835Q2F1_VANPL|nr:hypothetical protein HPP92_021655 [Vanilla planifolia]
MPQCSPAVFVACTCSIAGQTTQYTPPISGTSPHVGPIHSAYTSSSTSASHQHGPTMARVISGYVPSIPPVEAEGIEAPTLHNPFGKPPHGGTLMDLRAARFSGSRGPEPSDGFFVTVAVDGELAS